MVGVGCFPALVTFHSPYKSLLNLHAKSPIALGRLGLYVLSPFFFSSLSLLFFLIFLAENLERQRAGPIFEKVSVHICLLLFVEGRYVGVDGVRCKGLRCVFALSSLVRA